VVTAAIENDVDVIGLSSLAAGHLTLAPQIIAALKARRADDITLIVGGVVSSGCVAVVCACGCFVRAWIYSCDTECTLAIMRMYTQ
jgi:methylmalonyl-CoA mutase cobalamin-binding domain/chain